MLRRMISNLEREISVQRHLFYPLKEYLAPYLNSKLQRTYFFVFFPKGITIFDEPLGIISVYLVKYLLDGKGQTHSSSCIDQMPMTRPVHFHSSQAGRQAGKQASRQHIKAKRCIGFQQLHTSLNHSYQPCFLYVLTISFEGQESFSVSLFSDISKLSVHLPICFLWLHLLDMSFSLSHSHGERLTFPSSIVYLLKPFAFFLLVHGIRIHMIILEPIESRFYMRKQHFFYQKLQNHVSTANLFGVSLNC